MHVSVFVLVILALRTVRGLTSDQIVIGTGGSEGAANTIATALPDTMEIYLEVSPASSTVKYGYEQLFGPTFAWMQNYSFVWDKDSYGYLNSTGHTGVCVLENTSMAFTETARISESSGIVVGDIDFFGSDLFYVDTSSSKLKARFSDGTISKLSPSYEDTKTMSGVSNVQFLDCGSGAASFCVVYSSTAGLCTITKNSVSMDVTSACLGTVLGNPTRLKLFNGTRAVLFYAAGAYLYSVSASSVLGMSGYTGTEINDIAVLPNAMLAACRSDGLFVFQESAFSNTGLATVSAKYAVACSRVDTYGKLIVTYHDVASGAAPRPFLTEFICSDSTGAITAARQYYISAAAQNVTMSNSQLLVDSTYIYLYQTKIEVVVIRHSLPQQLIPTVDFIDTSGTRMALYKGSNSPYSRETDSVLAISSPVSSQVRIIFYSPYTATSGTLNCSMSTISEMPDLVLRLNVSGTAANCPGKAANYSYNTMCTFTRSIAIRQNHSDTDDGDTAFVYVLLVIPMIIVLVCIIFIIRSFKREVEQREATRQPISQMLVKQAEEAGVDFRREGNAN